MTFSPVGLLGISAAWVEEPPDRRTLSLYGSGLHIQLNLTAGGTIVGERFLRGAPFLAPLLFANMGALGPIALLSPAEPEPLGLVLALRGSHRLGQRGVE